MRRVVVGHYGGPEFLQVVEEDDPRPGPGEVRVRVLAAGVSFSDALLRSGGRLEVLAEVAQVADDLVERLDRAGVPDEDELASLVAGFPRCGAAARQRSGRVRGVTCAARSELRRRCFSFARSARAA